MLLFGRLATPRREARRRDQFGTTIGALHSGRDPRRGFCLQVRKADFDRTVARLGPMAEQPAKR
jgi:hypothetical protein